MCRRHDRLRDVIANLARDAGAHADIEVDVSCESADASTGAKMDVEATLTGAAPDRLLPDVSVTTPFAAGASGRAGAAATRAAAAKRAKYGRIRVTPAILETYGRAGDSLARVLRRLAPDAPEERAAYMAMALQSV